jgi:DDE superfamily endonuclease
VSEELGKPHKTVAQIAAQMVIAMRRWLPDIPMKLVGDSAYSVVELGLCCAKHSVSLIAPLRLDARLFAPAPPRKPGTNGRPRVKGEELPKLNAVLGGPKTEWLQVKVKWYDGTEQSMEVMSGTGVWYRSVVQECGTGLACRCCPSGGCSHVIPMGNLSRELTSVLTRANPQ